MTEPAKPITRLAVPIDRTGRRGRNRLGDAALRLAIYVWPAAFSLAILLYPALAQYWADASWLMMRISETLLGSIVPAGYVTATALAIAALVSAANRHLKRGAAIAALVISGPALILWGLWIGPSMPLILYDLFG